MPNDSTTFLSAHSFNVLMLDEPSNHLDMPTVDVLIEALKEFEGAMVLVTHDRRLVESIATHILVVEGTGTTMYDDVSSKVRIGAGASKRMLGRQRVASA